MVTCAYVEVISHIQLAIKVVSSIIICILRRDCSNIVSKDSTVVPDGIYFRLINKFQRIFANNNVVRSGFGVRDIYSIAIAAYYRII